MTPAPLLSLFAICLAFPAPAFAYERDLHYYATFALAVAAGWRFADARVIASADQGVDENKETVAALETSASPIPLLQAVGALKGDLVHQAARNFDLHSFSRVAGDANGFAKDVFASRLVCRQRLDEWMKVNRNGEISRPVRTQLLIATGVYLHCHQDMGSHQGYGGTCGNWLGACTAHVWDSYTDRSARRTNPDHPIVKPAEPNFIGGLEGTALALVRVLQDSGQKWKSIDTVPKDRIVKLADALRSGKIAALPDAERIACHRETVGAWLAEYLKTSSWARDIPAGATRPIAEAKCRVRDFGGAARFVAIPEPAYPKLDPRGHARSIDPRNGTYAEVTRAGGFDLAVDSVESAQECVSGACFFQVKIQIVNLGRSSAEPSLVFLAVIPRAENLKPAGVRIRQEALDPRKSRTLEVNIESPAGSRRLGDYLIYADIQPARSLEEKAWDDADVANDSLACAGERCRRGEAKER
jgi:hypothetical protein